MNQMPDYKQLVTNNRYFKAKPKTSFVPIPDGFVTSVGNPDLAAKYGNNLGMNNITTKEIIQSVVNKT
jgi:hypothetical protein